MYECKEQGYEGLQYVIDIPNIVVEVAYVRLQK